MKRKTIVLVACSASKRGVRSPAKDLYTGQLFRAARAWAERHADEWAILSAKHFLVLPDEEIDPYEKRMPTSADYRGQWNSNVHWFVMSRWCMGAFVPDLTIPVDPGWPPYVKLDTASPAYPRIVVFAGKEYRAAFVPKFPKPVLPIEVPLEGLGIGKQLAWFKRELGAVPEGELEGPPAQLSMLEDAA